MRKSVTIFIASVAIFVCQLASSASMTPYTKITTIEVHDWAGIVVHLENQTAAQAEGCGFQGSILLKKDHYLFEVAYSTLLSALHSGADIRFWVIDCQQHGTKTIPIIRRIDVKRS